MNILWFKNTKNEAERNKLKEALVNSKYTMDILRNNLKKMLEEKDSTSSEDYKIPNWACYQADRNGYKRAINDFLNLLNIKED